MTVYGLVPPPSSSPLPQTPHTISRETAYHVIETYSYSSTIYRKAPYLPEIKSFKKTFTLNQ